MPASSGGPQVAGGGSGDRRSESNGAYQQMAAEVQNLWGIT